METPRVGHHISRRTYARRLSPSDLRRPLPDLCAHAKRPLAGRHRAPAWRGEDQGASDRDAAGAILRGTQSEIETNLKSHAGKLYHLGGDAVSRSALSSANASRPAEFFADLLAALMKSLQAGYRRKIGDCVRLVDSTSVQLSNLSGHWATFSAGVCGAKAHIVYDPDADQPLYLMVTPSNVNNITAAKQMPIEAGATYVFDLGYYDYGWWAMLDQAGCRIVTRL